MEFNFIPPEESFLLEIFKFLVKVKELKDAVFFNVIDKRLGVVEVEGLANVN